MGWGLTGVGADGGVGPGLCFLCPDGQFGEVVHSNLKVSVCERLSADSWSHPEVTHSRT